MKSVLTILTVSILSCSAETPLGESFYDAMFAPVNKVHVEAYGVRVDDTESSYSATEIKPKKIEAIKPFSSFKKLRLNEYILEIPSPGIEINETKTNARIDLLTDNGRFYLIGETDDLIRDSLTIPEKIKKDASEYDLDIKMIEAKLASLREESILSLHKEIFATSASDLDENHPVIDRVIALFKLGIKPGLIPLGDYEKVYLYEDEDTKIIIAYPYPDKTLLSAKVFPKNIDASLTCFGKLGNSKKTDDLIVGLVGRLLKIKIERANKTE